MGDQAVGIVRWGRDRARELSALSDVALPGESLTEDELEACCWDDPDPSVVLGLPGGAGAAAAVVHEVRGRRTGFVQYLAVEPEHRRRGHGFALVAALSDWAFAEQDASALAVGGCGPFYLWPGVDTHATAALCLFEAAGFRPVGAEFDMAFPTKHRAPVPRGLELRRVLADDDATQALAFVGRHWPTWVAETARAIEHGTCHVAVDEPGATEKIVGFGCHSVNRLGWLGPMGTDPQRRTAGVGNALLGAIATDLRIAGLDSVEVSWVGPLGFYAKAAGASVSRVFRTLVLGRPAVSR